MDKKDLKFYAAPAVELMVMEAASFLCGSPTNADNADVEQPGDGGEL